MESEKILFIDNASKKMQNIYKVALEIISDILVKRIEFEEDKLYPLYTI